MVKSYYDIHTYLTVEKKNGQSQAAEKGDPSKKQHAAAAINKYSSHGPGFSQQTPRHI